MSNYRENFIKKNPGVKRKGPEGGYWYRCAHCGKWCGRPGGDRVVIPDDALMECDHILPFSKSGSDSTHNIQPLCKPCNRSKSADMTTKDKVKTAINCVAHPVDMVVKAPFRKIGYDLGLRKR